MRIRTYLTFAVLLWAATLTAPSLANGPSGRATVPQRDQGESGLRDAAHLASLIEQLDQVRTAGDALPIHALDLSLRKAVERELANRMAELVTGRELRLQSAASIGESEQGLKRHEAYGTPLTSTVGAAEALKSQPEKRTYAKSSPAFEADFERRRRRIIQTLHELDDALDDNGLNQRRALLVELLALTRERDRHRQQRSTELD